jgi:hypothetical protein
MRIEIVQHEDAENPREWEANLGTMLCRHRRYSLGDHEATASVRDALDCAGIASWDEAEQYLREHHGAAVVLPIYLYDHSGLALSTAPFSCSWDSGQVGLIYATRDLVLANWNRKRLTRKLRAAAEDALRAEVEVYHRYVNGDVWGYRVLDHSGEELDSCWGFYGREMAEEEAEASLRHYQQDQAA